MTRTKLIRNLRRGDRVQISDDSGHRAVIEVLSVQERRMSPFTGKRRWEVCARYPWWWGIVGIMGYHDTRIEVLD